MRATLAALALPEVPCVATPPEQDDTEGGVAALDSRRKAIPQSYFLGFTPVTGPYEPMPRDSTVYREGLALRKRIEGVGLLGATPIPGPERDLLLRDWSEVESIRTALINDSRPLDADDESLYRLGARLVAWGDRIDIRKQAGDQALTQYNGLCRGHPLPADEHQQCKSWLGSYNSCVQRHNSSLAGHDRLVDTWEKDKADLEEKGAAFKSRVAGWENNRIKPWTRRAQGALEGKDRNRVSIHTQPVIPGGDEPRLTDTVGDDLTRAEALSLADTAATKIEAHFGQFQELSDLIIKTKNYLNTATLPGVPASRTIGKWRMGGQLYRLDVEITGTRYPMPGQ